MKTILAILLGALSATAGTNSNFKIKVDPLGDSITAGAYFFLTNSDREIQCYISRTITEGRIHCYIGATLFSDDIHLLDDTGIFLCDTQRLKWVSNEFPVPKKIKGEWVVGLSRMAEPAELAKILNAKTIQLRLRIDDTNSDFECEDLSGVREMARYCATNPIPIAAVVRPAVPRTTLPGVIPSSSAIPAEVMAGIKRDAAKLWPGNYDMQEYEINKQVEAYRRLRNR